MSGHFLTIEPLQRWYCKTPILCLEPSKILTPHRPASVYPSAPPPPLVRGEDTLARCRRGWVVNILEDARHSSVLYIRQYFVIAPLPSRPEDDLLILDHLLLLPVRRLPESAGRRDGPWTRRRRQSTPRHLTAGPSPHRRHHHQHQAGASASPPTATAADGSDDGTGGGGRSPHRRRRFYGAGRLCGLDHLPASGAPGGGVQPWGDWERWASWKDDIWSRFYFLFL